MSMSTLGRSTAAPLLASRLPACRFFAAVAGGKKMKMTTEEAFATQDPARIRHHWISDDAYLRPLP
eukprot:CAMPEP_0175445602 /NCGR_PEP_ID=MMETSP0095-20121207/59834_1 /TAXON_ID=311494 /ORGANISM="Alexandrium monilatum, Strain CCMP3105" /LENGTH=65 /DNA_ID=CAMNT_0016745839 /DNA_START=32 /DNA_END=226 /DNA_ORIENTATION=+